MSPVSPPMSYTSILHKRTSEVDSHSNKNIELSLETTSNAIIAGNGICKVNFV